ncbi:hypothetical protein ACIZ62_12895 [Acetobacterium carbinolicum]|uniref:hypothetical protein n=1 Tax=Acetobacterium carbinolicum TaxID=52690 RepID=UPI0039BFB9C9
MSLSNMIGLRRSNAEKIHCRTCKHAEKSHICRGRCEIFEHKPDDVYFDNAPCPKYEKGEDLLKYEIEI